MSPEAALLPAFALLVAAPPVSAWLRRGRSRAGSETAALLEAFAREVRREGRCLVADPALLAQIDNLRASVPESAAFLLALQLPALDPDALADAALRLSLRLRRRIAFERKMLARTRAGVRRGTLAAALPPLALVALLPLGVRLPPAALVFVFAVEALGCWLLWRHARVEV